MKIMLELRKMLRRVQVLCAVGLIGPPDRKFDGMQLLQRRDHTVGAIGRSVSGIGFRV